MVEYSALLLVALGFILSYMGFGVGDGIGIYIAMDAAASVIKSQFPSLVLGYGPYIDAAALAVAAATSVAYGARRSGAKGALTTLFGFAIALTARIVGVSIVEFIADATLNAAPFITNSIPLFNVSLVLASLTPLLASAGVFGGMIAVLVAGISGALTTFIAGAFTGLHRRIHEFLEAAGVARPWTVVISIGVAVALSIVVVLAWIANVEITLVSFTVLMTIEAANIAKGKTLVLALDAIVTMMATIITGLMVAEMRSAISRAIRSIGGRPSITLIPIAFGIASVIVIAVYAPLLLAAVFAWYLMILLTLANYILRRVSGGRASYAIFTLGSMYWIAVVTNTFRQLVEAMSRIAPVFGF